MANFVQVDESESDDMDTFLDHYEIYSLEDDRGSYEEGSSGYTHA